MCPSQVLSKLYSINACVATCVGTGSLLIATLEITGWKIMLHNQFVRDDLYPWLGLYNKQDSGIVCINNHGHKAFRRHVIKSAAFGWIPVHRIWLDCYVNTALGFLTTNYIEIAKEEAHGRISSLHTQRDTHTHVFHHLATNQSYDSARQSLTWTDSIPCVQDLQRRWSCRNTWKPLGRKDRLRDA